MGDIIGGVTGYSTWATLRQAAGTNNPDTPPLVTGDYNREYPSGNYFLKTTEGNGLIRTGGFFRPSAGFALYKSNPENPGIFYCGGFVEPDNETILDKVVSMTDGSFDIEPEAFTDGQDVGTDPKLPFTGVELFTFLT
jgi:hypothetical protein